MSVDEYLRTSFDGADREYVDGEVVERNMGDLPHAILQSELLVGLRSLGREHGLQVLAEIRIQVSPTRFRVADIAAWRAGPIGRRIPTVPPFLRPPILEARSRTRCARRARTSTSH